MYIGFMLIINDYNWSFETYYGEECLQGLRNHNDDGSNFWG
jgi:hypothetical protein